MASDFRALQHDAAMACHSLSSAVGHLLDMQRQHPAIVAAEGADIQASIDKLSLLLDGMARYWRPSRSA